MPKENKNTTEKLKWEKAFEYSLSDIEIPIISEKEKNQESR